jgi:GTP cyclohydrolase I
MAYDFKDEIGDNHIATNFNTPLRPDAFDLTDEQKIESIKKRCREHTEHAWYGLDG